MLTVEELIGNLLLRHNCVIVPSFGGFVAKQSSATIDYVNGVMLPPRKSVLFNRQLINSDGLLVSEYSLVNNLYYAAAEENIRERVSDWNEKLRSGERVSLDRVGYLFFDQEKNICFEQDRFFNLLLESYGLGKVHFVSETDIKVANRISTKPEISIVPTEEAPLIQLVPLAVAIDAVEQPTEKQTVVIDHPQIKKYSRVWRYIAAAVLVPIGFYSFWIPMKTNVLESGVLSINDFNPGYTATEGTYEKKAFKKMKFKKAEQANLEKEISGLPSDVDTYPFAFTDYTHIRVRVPKSEATPMIQYPDVVQSVNPVDIEPKEVKKPEKKTSQPTPAPAKSGNFNFVVGSFSTEEHANQLVNQLKEKGLNAFVISDASGSHRVSAGSASTSSEINAIGEKSKAAGVNGWVLKK